MPKISVTWKRGFDPDVVLKELDNVRMLDKEKVSFQGVVREYFTVLSSMIQVDSDIPADAARGLVMKGFWAAARKRDWTKEYLLACVKKTVREYLKQEKKSHRLLATLNIKSNNNLPSYRINGCYLRFSKGPPKKYRAARLRALREFSSQHDKTKEEFSFYVVANAADKSMNAAVEKMIIAIDLIRGIWNLRINNKMAISFGARKNPPINKITLGHLHTVHNEWGGENEERFYCYQQDYFMNHKIINFAREFSSLSEPNLPDVLKFTKKVRGLLKKHNYREDVEHAIIRYVRALDTTDYNVAFINLWGILEFLTHALPGDNHTKIVTRVSPYFRNSEYYKQVLEHLRLCRNDRVHSGITTATLEQNIEVSVYLLKDCVETLLWFHIRNQFKLKNLQEAAEFMDLSENEDVLKRQIELRESRIKYT